MRAGRGGTLTYRLHSDYMVNRYIVLQHGRVDEYNFVQHRYPELDAGMAMMCIMLLKYGQTPPDFKNRAWYKLYLHSRRADHTAPLSYSAHLNAAKLYLAVLCIRTLQPTYLTRASSARMLIAYGLAVQVLQLAYKWRMDSMALSYTTAIPGDALVTAAGFNARRDFSSSYVVPWLDVSEAPEAMQKKLFPWAEKELHEAQRINHTVQPRGRNAPRVNKDLARENFIKLLISMRAPFLKWAAEVFPLLRQHPKCWALKLLRKRYMPTHGKEWRAYMSRVHHDKKGVKEARANFNTVHEAVSEAVADELRGGFGQLVQLGQQAARGLDDMQRRDINHQHALAVMSQQIAAVQSSQVILQEMASDIITRLGRLEGVAGLSPGTRTPRSHPPARGVARATLSTAPTATSHAAPAPQPPVPPTLPPEPLAPAQGAEARALEMPTTLNLSGTNRQVETVQELYAEWTQSFGGGRALRDRVDAYSSDSNNPPLSNNLGKGIHLRRWVVGLVDKAKEDHKRTNPGTGEAEALGVALQQVEARRISESGDRRHPLKVTEWAKKMRPTKDRRST